jgi:hypothetical protein
MNICLPYSQIWLSWASGQSLVSSPVLLLPLPPTPTPTHFRTLPSYMKLVLIFYNFLFHSLYFFYSFYLFACLFISIYLFIYLFIYLSIYLFLVIYVYLIIIIVRPIFFSYISFNLSSTCLMIAISSFKISSVLYHVNLFINQPPTTTTTPQPPFILFLLYFIIILV